MSGPHSWLATSEPGSRSQKTAFWTTCSATHHSPNLPFPPILMLTKLTLENNKGKGSIQEIGFMECRHLDKQKRAEREFRRGRGTVCADYQARMHVPAIHARRWWRGLPSLLPPSKCSLEAGMQLLPRTVTRLCFVLPPKGRLTRSEYSTLRMSRVRVRDDFSLHRNRKIRSVRASITYFY